MFKIYCKIHWVPHSKWIKYYQENYMSRESFRASIFNIIEYLNRYELSDTGKKLVLHYFNESRMPTSYRRAVESIERYLHDSLPEESARPPRLQQLIEEMAREAESWDSE